jgi:hypothetical protein
MKYESRLLWVAIDDIPKMIRKNFGFCVNNLAWDTDWCVVQLYDNEYIQELDAFGINWQYPTRNPGGELGRRRSHSG